jgi:hypothetical protein
MNFLLLLEFSYIQKIFFLLFVNMRKYERKGFEPVTFSKGKIRESILVFEKSNRFKSLLHITDDVSLTFFQPSF